jgi:hypothetical protein
MTAAAVHLRDEALLMLQGKGTILDVARRVSRLLDASEVQGAVIDGVAVVLHGHVRTTSDVDVFVLEPLDTFADQLRAAGFSFDPKQREFSHSGIPVHLVSPQQASIVPTELINIDEVRTVSLSDLINMKLHTGTRNVLRAQDLADAIGLIRHHQLGGEFAGHIDKPVRNEFRRLARAVRKESR